MARIAQKRQAQGNRSRRVRRKAAGKQAIVRMARSEVYPFRRFVYKLVQGGLDGTNFTGGLTFSLGDVPSGSDFETLFDQYKIGGIKYRWVLNRNPDFGGAVVSNVINPSAVGTYPRIMWVHDYDSANAPANLAELQQYPKAKEIYLTGDKPASRWYFFKPARLSVEYQTAVLSTYRPTWKGFVDMTQIGTPHYAIRWFADGLSSNVQLRLECWYYFVCKNVR